ncbi:hypothetical protein PPERSA_02393 [Pseudocohnilembus persalinus]|uniref:COMM domain-containing protein n=1 Tax=Pseudocohnilembus persalinus TaxID=266149 RepID=A0A0V0QBM3_PSEPJ|nr:hypothetical protein PPERSA_02393 [Pseudocohnilembus persalinus]|eukprot:KRW99535.1 hypothetical protein PPERSA_02393 [Pseudocohnilembus persalinus]
MEKFFPSDFPEELRNLLIDSLQNNGQKWVQTVNTNISQANRMVDLDWRLDIQVSTYNEVKAKHPVANIQMEIANPQKNDAKTLNFQMNNNEINSFHNQLKKIKEQLQMLVQNQQ